MSLIIRREAGGRTTAACGGSTEKDHIVLLFPGYFHAIQSLGLQVHIVPCVGVTPCCPVVIVAWNLDVTEAQTFGRREDWIEEGDSPPVREEMALPQVSSWRVTERELSGSFPSESEVGTRKRIRRTEVIGRAVDANRPLGTHESSGHRVWRAYAAISLPDTPLSPPVWNGKVAHSCSR
jgi:hypothetical protein